MRILHVNKFLYRRAGAEGYMLDLAEMQRAAGHEVAFFSTDHRDNVPSTFERSFPPYIEMEPPPVGHSDKLRAAGHMIYSPEARSGIDDVARAFAPDIVHLHNIYHHLSPSILRPLAKRRVPMVMTLHDYKLACPTYKFLDHGRICEACVPRRFYQAPLRRCKDGSLAASALAAAELATHTATRAYGPVDLFLCPSRFLAGRMAAGRVYPKRLRWIPNFVSATTISPARRPGEGVVIAGRLSEEKGVDVAIRAIALLGVRLDVAGDGPERPALEALADELHADVRFHGRLGVESLFELVRSARVSVVPSRWYENQPLAVLESFACAVPVVGTQLGGLPEIVTPGVDGDLVPPDDPSALAGAIGRLLADPAKAHEMGAAGRVKALSAFSPEVHLQRLDRLYAEARGPR